MNKQPLKDRVLEVTAVFETGERPPACYGGVSGNHDGMGISFGVLQSNFRSDSYLQPMLKTLISDHRDIMETIFGPDLATLEGVVSHMKKEERIHWGDSISIRNNNPKLDKHKIIEPWKSYFNALGQTQECRDLQSKHARWFFDFAYNQFVEFGLTSERGYALMFDILVQGGSTFRKIIERFNYSRSEDEEENMRIIAKLTADNASQANQAVLERKRCIANGSGNVYGTWYDMEKDFDITLNKAVFEETYAYA